MNKELLDKFFKNQCTEDEMREITRWFESNSVKLDLEKDFKKVWNELKVSAGNTKKWSDLLENVHECIHMEALYDSLNLAPSVKNTWKQRKLRAALPINPASEKSPRDLYRWSFYFGAMLLTIICLVGFYIWGMNQQLIKVSVQVIEKSTSAGQKMTIHLKDGSKVVLNSGSKLVYPEFFASDERIVHLTGEGYFEIARDVNRPFKVVTGKISTTALGTSFNIKTVAHHEDVEIALVTGKVKVDGLTDDQTSKPVYLQPGEMIRYSATIHSFQKNTFAIDNVIAWKDGKLIFKNADYIEIKEKLENWFGIKITENHLPGERWAFTANFDNENLDNILKALRFGHKFQYQIEQKEVTLTFNNYEKK